MRELLSRVLRARRLVLVWCVLLGSLQLAGSTLWPVEARYRSWGVTTTGSGEYMVVWSAWPTWEERYVVTDSEETARILDAALWAMGRAR